MVPFFANIPYDDVQLIIQELQKYKGLNCFLPPYNFIFLILTSLQSDGCKPLIFQIMT